MKTKLLTVLLFICATVTAGAAEISAALLYKVEMTGHNAPADVVIFDNGRIGVYDAFAGALTTYDKGKTVGTVFRGFLKGGNCLVKNGNYFIYCNKEAQSLDMLSESLDLYSSFTLPEGTKGEYDPTDALVSDGYIFSVDNDNHRIIKTDITTGKTEKIVGRYGQDKLAFWYPYAIAIDQKGVLLVSEVLNTRIQKVTKELKFYEYFGKWGINPGEFYRPTGIAVYKGSTLFVADGYTGVIQYLDGDGRFSGVLKDSSGRQQSFESVTHIRIKGDVLAVVDGFAKTVYVYEIKER